MKTKKLISVLLVAIMVLAYAPITQSMDIDSWTLIANAAETVQSGTFGENIIWTLDTETGKLVISGSGDMPSSTVPWSDYKSQIKTVVIEDGVTSIARYAFSDCYYLTNVTLSGSIKKIWAYAFYNCDGLTDFVVPNGVELIDDQAFYHCGNLASITIPDSILVLGNNVFKDTPNLKDVFFVGDISKWCAIEFNSYGNPMMWSGENFYDDGVLVTDLVIPYGVNTISSDAFNSFEKLEKVTIPESVTSIGNYAFSKCTNLQSVKLPNTITSISEAMFNECQALTNIIIPNTVTNIGRDAFSGCGLTNITIPNSVTSIGVGAFSGCKFQHIKIPDSVKEIKSYTFSSCKFLTNINIGNGVSSIGEYAFSHCIALDNISFGYSVEEIGSHAFYDCTALESVIVPDNVTDIYGYAFANCDKLKTVHVPESAELHSYYVFYGSKNVCICSITENSFAKTYADERGLTFKVCDGHESGVPEISELTNGKDSATNITYSYEKDSFDYNGDIDFEVIRKTKEEYADSFRGYADESDDIFFYDIKFYAVGESNNLEIQPKTGKKVKIGFPIPDGYKTANPNLFMVLHKRSDNGKLEFFKPSNNNIEIKDGYIYIWADNFSPFAIVVNYTESNKTVSSIAIAKLPSKTAYTYRNDSLDLSGLALTVTYSDGTTETVTDTSKMKVTGFDNSKTGEQTVTVEYEGVTAEFDVTVSYAWWQWIIRILLLGFLWY